MALVSNYTNYADFTMENGLFNTYSFSFFRAGESLPVVFSSQCYGKDKLMSISMKNDQAADNKAAARYGYARIGVSTPDGHWTFGLVLHVQSQIRK